MRNLRTVATNVGSTFVALTFIGLGLVELFNPAALGACATWGYPQRFRVLVVTVEICGGLLFLVPQVAWYSAALLGILLAGVISTHLWSGPAQLLLPAGALFIVVGLAGYVRHPRTFALARLRAVADAVAEREIAQQRGPLAPRGKPKKQLRATSAKTRRAGRAAVATNSGSRSSGV